MELRQYPAELRERAVRLVEESVKDGRGECDAIRSVAEKLGVGSAETIRLWLRRAQAAADPAAVERAEESAEVRRLKAEDRELRRANDILKATAGFFAADLDRPHRTS